MEEMCLQEGDRFLIYRESGVVYLRKVDDSSTMEKQKEMERREREEFLEAVENWFLTHLKGFEDRMTFQGRLESMPLPEILLFLAMSRKTGLLIFRRPRETKKVYFEKGEIVFAASSRPEERLGDLLMEQGKVTREQYRKSARKIRPGKRQGKVLVEMGVITPEELWKVVCAQVESIVHSLFAWGEGSFEFIEGGLPTEERIKLSVSTPNLILEGMRKIQGRKIFDSHLPEGDRVLYRNVGDQAYLDEIGLSGEEESLLSLIESGMRVEEVCRKSAFPEEESREILLRLLSAGVIRSSKVRSPYAEAIRIEDSDNLIDRIEQCNIIFRLITEFVRMSVGDRVHVILGAFFRGIDHGEDILFENISLEPDGSLDVRSLLANISEYLPWEREAILEKGLHTLLRFQLFAVRNNLGSEQEGQVLSALKEMEFLR